MSKMIINPMLPQTVWVGCLPGDDEIFAIGSHIGNDREKEILQKLLCRRFIDYPYHIGLFWNDVVSQHLSGQTMDDQQWLQPMAADSGDDAYMPEDFGDCYTAVDASTSFARNQTTAVGVSAVNAGGNFDPSHSHPVGNEQMFLQNLRTANGHTRSFGSNYDPRQFSWQAYSANGGSQGAGYLDFADGIQGDNWHSNMPVFGEPLEGTQVSPSSFSSSAHSSATSEAMAAMTLGPMTVNGNTAENLQVNAPVSGSENSANNWASEYPSTISPKMLRIHPSPTPNSSSESIHNNMLANAEPDLGTSVFEHHHARGPFYPQRSGQKPRKELPSKPVRARQVPIVSPEPPSSKGKRPATPQLPMGHQQPTQKAKIKPERHDAAPYGNEGPSAHGRNVKLVEDSRAAKDDFLVRSKLAGMTYREIRQKGNFVEAESTLRGRFRTLTKDKEARVRKPEWQENDIRLLRKAVRKLNKGDDMKPAKAPWGQVADYILANGGSYQFGGATCHRKWKELMEEDRAGSK